MQWMIPLKISLCLKPYGMKFGFKFDDGFYQVGVRRPPSELLLPVAALRGRGLLASKVKKGGGWLSF